MKRIIAVVLVAMLLASVMSASALASTYYTYHTTGKRLNVRYGPGTKYGVKDQLYDKGVAVCGLSSSGNWRKVRIYDEDDDEWGITGWISKTYLSSKIRGRVATSYDPLVVRSGPGKGYKKRGTLPRYTRVTISKINGNWAYLTARGLTGWCSLTYLRILNWYD